MNVDLLLAISIWFLIASSVLSMVRVLIGPTSADRMIGLNLVGAQVLALLVLIAVRDDQAVTLDVALVYDIFGFIGILALARYLGGRGAGS